MRAGFWGAFFLLFATIAATAQEPRRVLLLQAYGNAFSPWSYVNGTYRAELAKRSPEPVDLYEVSLDIARFQGLPEDPALVEYLRTHFAKRKFDLIVTMGQLPARFVQRYRAELFTTTPAVSMVVDQRRVSEPKLGAYDIVVAMAYDLTEHIKNILLLRPATKDVVVAMGNSPLERSWLPIMQREYKALANRVNFIWLNDLSVDEMAKRVANLSPQSAIYYFIFVEDAKGVPYPHDRALEVLHETANAPIFGIYDFQLGRGIVGGPLIPTQAMARQAADVSARILRGESLSGINSPPLEFGVAEYDSRELRKWGISESLLPPGSIVRFREPSLWERHRGLILAVLALFTLQSLFVVALLIQRRRRYQAERTLRDSEERMSFTATAVKVALWRVDRATDELWASEQAWGMFGLAPNVSVTREALLKAVHPDDRDTAAHAIEPVAERDFLPSDFRVVVDDEVRWVRCRCRSHIGNRSSPDRLSGFFVDITDRKNAEAKAAEQRQELAHLTRVSILGELSGAVAHEINQPLTAILSNAQAAQAMLAQNPPDLSEIADTLQDIVDADSRAGEVVNRLRTIMKKGESVSAPLDINELVTTTTALLRSEMISRGVKCNVDLAASAPMVLGDNVQLQQVLLNLLMNAMDAMNSTPLPYRTVAVRVREIPSDMLEIEVVDRGVGLQAGTQGRAFEPFFTTKEHGLGLGLSICSSIIDAHGGSLKLANNSAGAGATASFTVPRQQQMLVAAK